MLEMEYTAERKPWIVMVPVGVHRSGSKLHVSRYCIRNILKSMLSKLIVQKLTELQNVVLRRLDTAHDIPRVLLIVHIARCLLRWSDQRVQNLRYSFSLFDS